MMQVLPSTAKDPNVDIADIDKIENNIHAAAKYMRFVTDTFFPDAKTDEFNRTMFSFASYNAGPAKIAKLRRQAATVASIRTSGSGRWSGWWGADRARDGAVRQQHPQVLRRIRRIDELQTARRGRWRRHPQSVLTRLTSGVSEARRARR